MSNPIVSPKQILLLRTCLGLGFYTKKPTKNHLLTADYVDNMEDVEKLVDMELMTSKSMTDHAGRRIVYMATDEGRRLALEYPENPAHASSAHG